MDNTLTYSDEANGWTSFYDFEPDMICNLNNRLFTVKNGQLWLHNDESNTVRNNFYGQQFNSKVATIFNDEHQLDKIFKTLVLESNAKWNAKIETNLNKSTITSNEFNTRESRQFSFIRGSEEANSLHGNAAQGIGVISSVSTNQVMFSIIPDLISVGDALFQINGSAQQQIGIIQSINKINNLITVAILVTIPVAGLYCYSKKNSRIEGEEIRGYFAKVTLENTDTTPVELFSVSTNAIQSYV
ncbi:hypothetical protein [Flavobacterium sp.]|uniref:hypothetical protein n=1 Tax=Flavobacterium sp. TaxID=239 RepID=UPI003752558D